MDTPDDDGTTGHPAAPGSTPSPPRAWLDLPATHDRPALTTGVLSYRHQITAEVTLARTPEGDPRRIGRSRHGVVSVSRRLDHASPALLQAVSAGTRLPRAVLRVQRPSDEGPPRPWFRFTLEEVHVVSVLTTLDADGPLETIELDYATIAWAYEGPPPTDGATAPPTAWTVHGADHG